MTAYEKNVSDPAPAGRRTSLAPAPNKGTSKLKQKEHITALAFISVKYVGLFIFTLLPLLLALLYSFTDYTGAESNATSKRIFPAFIPTPPEYGNPSGSKRSATVTFRE